MARGRRNAKREAAETRVADAESAAAEARAVGVAREAKERQILRRWGALRGALDRLSTLSTELERLHRQEQKLLNERDDLVSLLRSHGQTWNALSARTKLSRQALMKRDSYNAARTSRRAD